MDLSWFQSIIYGFLSGFMDILPVSARVHSVLLLKFFGTKGDTSLMDMLIHLGIFISLYFDCQAQIIRMSRARALARVPKRKRKRPLDTRSLMDLSLLKTMLVPVILGLLAYSYTEKLQTNLMLIAVLLFVNGIVLYTPMLLPSGNRDSRTMSRVEGLLMGLGGAATIFPGLSAMGLCTSIGSVCGVDRKYTLNMALLMQLFLTLGFLIYDITGIAATGIGTFSIGILIRYLAAAVCAFVGTQLGIKIMRYLAEEQGYSMFGFYCFGLALFTFILNLLA